MKSVKTKTVSAWKTFFSPKVITFFIAVPFLIIMPLLLTSFLFGFPLPYYLTNNQFSYFKDTFKSIELPADTSSIGKDFYLVSNIKNNIDLDKKLKEEVELKKEEAKKNTPPGEFKEIEEVTPFKAEREIYNGCDFFAGKVLTINSDKTIDGLSSELLSSFTKSVQSQIENKSYKYIYQSNLKVYPINKDSLEFDIEGYRVNIKNDFKISENNIIDGKTYLVYMFNDNVNKFPDPRCK